MRDSDQRQAGMIEVTPAMVEAGVWALEDSRDSSSAFVAKSVFEAMIAKA